MSTTHHQVLVQTDVFRIKVTYRDSKGNDLKTVEGNEGDDLLILAHEYDIDLEGEIRVSTARQLDSSTARSAFHIAQEHDQDDRCSIGRDWCFGARC